MLNKKIYCVLIFSIFLLDGYATAKKYGQHINRLREFLESDCICKEDYSVCLSLNANDTYTISEKSNDSCQSYWMLLLHYKSNSLLLFGAFHASIH